MATQTLTFLFVDIEGSAAMVQRLGDAYAGWAGQVFQVHAAGFRFEEADAGRPYQPAMLAGRLDSIIAVRQVTPAARRIGDPDRARAAHNGHRADQAARLLAGAGRWAAEG